jgi:predicted RNase H-like HicB family nuclease
MPIYEVSLEEEEDGWIVAHCPDPDVVSQGRGREDALRNIEEAIRCYVMSFEGEENPEVKVVEVELTSA